MADVVPTSRRRHLHLRYTSLVGGHPDRARVDMCPVVAALAVAVVVGVVVAEV